MHMYENLDKVNEGSTQIPFFVISYPLFFNSVYILFNEGLILLPGRTENRDLDQESR